jgi:hypothetical protein
MTFDPHPTPAERRRHHLWKWLARFAFLAAIAGSVFVALFHHPS